MSSLIDSDLGRVRSLIFYDGVNSTTVTNSGSLATNLNLILPPTSGSNKYLLQTNGSGILTWEPSGLKSIHFNSVGAIGGTNQTLYLLPVGTTSTQSASRYYFNDASNVVLSNIRIVLSGTLLASATFRITKNGISQTTIVTTTSTTSTINIPFAPGDYLNLIMETTTNTDKVNVNITITYQ